GIALDVLGQMRRPALVDLPRDAVLCRQTMADQIAPRLAEGGDEHQLVFMARGNLAERVIEQDRPRLRRNELVRLLENLSQNEIEIDIAAKRQAALVSLEKSLELWDFE